MRRFGRRAAIVATSVALLLAAAGTSLAAVRASRYEGGVASPGLALPAPVVTGSATVDGSGSPPGTTLEPATGPVDLGPSIPSSGPAAGPGPGGPSPSAPPAGAAASPAPAAGPIAGQAPSTTAAHAVTPAGAGATPPTLPPASGPTPTTTPSRPSSLGCPGDGGQGALAHAGGALQAVNFTLPWPDAGPVALLPQTSAARPAAGRVTIVDSSAGDLAQDHASVTLPVSLPVQYTLAYDQQVARGAIIFTPAVGVRVNLVQQACRDRSFTLYDVEGASQEGSPLRIVGVAAPTASVVVDDGGGTAHFRSAVPGRHTVTLLTASDLGAPGPVVTATVTVS